MRSAYGMGMKYSADPFRKLGKREIKTLMPFLRPYRKPAIGAAVLVVTTTALKLSGPVFLQRAIDLGIKANDRSSLTLNGIMFVIAAVSAFFTLRFSTLLMGSVGQRALKDMRVGAFRHLVGLSLGFFERERSGKLVARVTTDVEAVERLVTEDLIRLVTEILFLFGAAVLLLVLDLRLGLAALSVVPLMAIGTFIFRRAAGRAYQELRERVARVLTFLHETLQGVSVVQAFSRETANSARFDSVNDDWAEAKFGTQRLEASYFSLMEILGGLGTAAVLVYGGSRFIRGDLEIGTLTSFIVYLALFFEPVHHMSERFATLASALAGLSRIAHLLEETPQILEVAKPVDFGGSAASGLIELKGVEFKYRPELHPALHDVTLTVQPGETLALVGPTGAGKSTIVKLMARFYDVTAGSLRMDGVDVKNLAFSSLRSSVALVPQEGFLFAGTVRDNVRFAKPGASDSEIENICRELGIDEFIRSLPDGYDTQVSERGARLAAGQKQLIALARALASNPSIILLDEATSSLDSATEARLDSAFRRALKGRTSVVIAHRLSTVIGADRIAVVDHGRVVENGSHAELVEHGGRYAALYKSWLATPIPA